MLQNRWTSSPFPSPILVQYFLWTTACSTSLNKVSEYMYHILARYDPLVHTSYSKISSCWLHWGTFSTMTGKGWRKKVHSQPTPPSCPVMQMFNCFVNKLSFLRKPLPLLHLAYTSPTQFCGFHPVLPSCRYGFITKVLLILYHASCSYNSYFCTDV